jgi:hypothetical protein
MTDHKLFWTVTGLQRSGHLLAAARRASSPEHKWRQS